ncbi:hypothetical protein L2E82_01545 [Cichorium intybus]|uniref:Uncharacterized protein n=1 Tax=Cichorium intybus TaxID=13427 RepID=A0ACB9GYV2_CICIN|nr:hypothetical protein L2E82_01545 [Cichorium intybus]
MSVNHQIDSGSGEIKGGGGDEEESSKQKKPIGYGRRAKRVVLSKIKKAKKQLQRSKTKENGNSISRSSGCCCLYIRRKPTLDSSSESPTSDPNSSEFGYDSLKVQTKLMVLENGAIRCFASDVHEDDRIQVVCYQNVLEDVSRFPMHQESKQLKLCNSSYGSLKIDVETKT